jgi:ABC-2 type transport system ATP-binding protein
MCSRLLIMYGGKILAADTPENLQKLVADNGQIVAEIAADVNDLHECWSQMPGVEEFEVSPGKDGFQRCALTSRDGYDLRPAVFTVARERGWVLRELTRSQYSLEDIYVHVTRPNEEDNE